ncbi:hypothetical protein CGCS363_v008065 [Colletotrichum siamense]|uniref:uncharacterized protein n=1 Tax=Colletotrichum siamense TaxID=690259 RepID=UPI001872C651|nr:uncharacterized protein CGCS363_v008065 [Colletotrichum siamense]KAF5497022.1 hypothetical protein CGCS363_v008065 [Colletotrichum siamense]
MTYRIKYSVTSLGENGGRPTHRMIGYIGHGAISAVRPVASIQDEGPKAEAHDAASEVLRSVHCGAAGCIHVSESLLRWGKLPADVGRSGIGLALCLVLG